MKKRILIIWFDNNYSKNCFIEDEISERVFVSNDYYIVGIFHNYFKYFSKYDWHHVFVM